jgi:hypothetical protein
VGSAGLTLVEAAVLIHVEKLHQLSAVELRAAFTWRAIGSAAVAAAPTLLATSATFARPATFSSVPAVGTFLVVATSSHFLTGLGTFLVVEFAVAIGVESLDHHLAERIAVSSRSTFVVIIRRGRGCRPERDDRRDRDHHKSFHFKGPPVL